MAKQAQSVFVEQNFNPRFDSNKPITTDENYEFGYKVTKTVNTIQVAIGQWLPPNKVKDLMDSGVTVTVTPVKS